MLRNDARTCPTDGSDAEDVEKLPKDTRLGNYKIERMLGEGGMGFVYEATHEVLNRRTAIKLLRPELATHEQVVTRFLNEAKAVNLIDHQNIINVYDYGDGADGSVYFVMEYLEGETLDDLMRKRKPMALSLLLHTFSQIAKALAAAHAKQIVHRDLKPANVYVIAREDNPYFIKLLDFGIAQLRGEGAVQGLTQAGSIMGTPQYMSPEQISGGAVDHRTDVWAMGVMMYRAATGHAPFKGEGFGELAGKILQESPKSSRELVSTIPVELDKLIKSCLERNLSDRCQSIAELIEGLERVKVATKLDDAAILAAVWEDAGAGAEDAPETIAERTRKSMAGSMPQYQGVDQKVIDQARAGKLPVRAKTPLPFAEPKSKTGLFVVAGLAVVGLGVGAYFAFGRGGSPAKTEAPPIAAKSEEQPKPDLKPAAKLTPIQAAETAIKEAIASGNLQQQGQAVDALALVRHINTAPHLYTALKGSPEIRVKAARALGDLELPDAAPKIRAALAESGDKVKVELAAVLVKLGDKDALAILKRAVSDPGMKLAAAIALAESGDDKTAKPVLAELFESTPAGREQWRRSAYGLTKLGDAKAKAALEGELAQPDAARAVAAAELLALTGDAKAKDYLKRVGVDPDFARRAEATIALARMGSSDTATWLDNGFKSADAEERKLAIAISALIKDITRDGELAKLAADDPDRSVRLTAAAALIARGN
ncbi:MAG: protein kinase [Deltaproteobacteria bacterium]|nr:protein kinase [Deltaproteobacteria bacterium]